MDMQEASGSTNAKSICISSEQLCVNIGISSLHGHQLKEMASSVYDHATKVRKPYTITKQRERWTDEEHEKFLEALKLYGRAWRQIEEHIGSKTAVQIRSHAQKFFSKVAHESAIEIPPPRPKRKPTHPYPRKLGHSRSSRTPEQPEWSYAPIPSPSEQENRSPTSVLSAFRSDTPGPSVSNLPSGCTSQFSSMAGSNQAGMFMSHGDNRGQLHVPSSEEEDRSPSPGLASPMELSLGAEVHAPLEEDTSVEAQGTSLKLFGRTVLVTDPQKLYSGSVQCPNLPCTSEIQSRDRSADADMHTQAQPIPSEDFQGAPGDATWSQWPPMLFCLPPCGDSANSAVPVPWWWTLCGTSQFQFSNAGAEQDACQLEGSSNGSETGSASHMVDSRSAGPPTSELPPSSILRHCASSAFSSFNPGVPKPAKGFMPYKRCATKRAIVDLPVDDLDGDCQPIELCL